MARPVGVRPAYDKDAAFFLRVKEALGKDETLEQAWRKEATELLTRLARMFVNVDEHRRPTEETPSDPLAETVRTRKRKSG